jgi:peroxiredoxin (alkyl hydroperoxide reductase subunit C)
MHVGNQATDFTCAAVLASGQIIDQFNFYEETKDQYAVLFFYPLDFTFVCPTEMLALHRRMQAFKAINTKVITVSIDSQFTHQRWRKTPVNDGGIGNVDYIMAADVSHEICRAYGVQHAVASVAYRASIIIDKSKVIRAKHVNDLPIGRNIDELIRTVQALQYTEKHGEVCQAGWQVGDAGFEANEQGVRQFLGETADQL